MEYGSWAEGRYRPYCDACGGKLWQFPLSLRRARSVAREHAFRVRHLVRIEPWDSFALIEHIAPPAPHPADATPSDGPGAASSEARG
jgi:hypothetical protein